MSRFAALGVMTLGISIVACGNPSSEQPSSDTTSAFGVLPPGLNVSRGVYPWVTSARVVELTGTWKFDFAEAYPPAANLPLGLGPAMTS